MAKLLFTCGNLALKGGVERVVVNLANALQKQGYEVEILSYYKDSKAAAPCVYPLDPSIKLSYLYPYDEPVRRGLSRIFWRFFGYIITNVLLNKRHKACIVIESHFSFLYPIFKAANTRYVRIMHIEISRYKKRKNGYFDALVFLSQSEFDKWGAMHPRAVKIPNSIPLPFEDLSPNLASNQAYISLLDSIDPGAKEELINPNPYLSPRSLNHCRAALLAALLFRESRPYLKPRPTVLAVGRLAKQKGFERLISAWSRVASLYPSWRLDIVGEDCGEGESLKHQIQNLGLKDSVRLRPFTPHIQVQYLLASLFALSSYMEGMPMVLLEAMAHGLPLLAYKIDSILECFEDNGILACNDDEFCAGLARLMADEGLRLRLGWRGALLAKMRFSQEVVLGKYCALFDSMLDGGGGGGG